MNLTTLSSYDERTANAILATAALATSPIAEDSARPYAREADELLAEIRSRLNLSDDDKSVRARSSVDNFLTNAIKQSVLKVGIDGPLARAGQAGNIPTSMYRVEESDRFLQFFRPLGVRKRNVEDTIRSPDDYQHLMTDNADSANKETISLFMKKVIGISGGNFWLLVQTHRSGLQQIVQSAWRIYPDELDLRTANRPLDVLKAFVDVYGLTVLVRGREVLFLESELAPKNELLRFGVQIGAFGSVSTTHTTDPNMVQVGIAYSINLPKYKAALKARGVNL